MAVKAKVIEKQARFKMNVHNCENSVIYVVPDQEVCHNDVDIYAITLSNEVKTYDNRYYPEGVAKTFHKYCPLCGTPLLQEYEVEL